MSVHHSPLPGWHVFVSHHGGSIQTLCWGKSWLGILMVNGLLMLVNLCWGKWVTSLIKDMLVNILLLYFSLFLQKHLKNWTWWRKTFNLRRRRFWHAVRVVLKNTHITSSHHHIVNFGMQNSFFGLPRFLLSLCFWHFKGPFGPQCILLGLFGWPFADAPDHFQTADESHGDGTEGHPPSNAHQYKGRSDDDSNLM